MAELSTAGWVGAAIIAGLGVLGMLNAAASVIRNQTFVHDTRVRVNTLKQEYFGRPDDDDGDTIEAEPVDAAAPKAR